MGLELVEQELNPPAQRVRPRDVFRLESSRADIREVQVIVGTVVPHTNRTEESFGRVPAAAVCTSSDVERDLNVEYGGLDCLECRLQSLPDHRDGAATMLPVPIDDEGVDALLRANDEVSTQLIDARQQAVVEVPEIEDQQLAADPRTKLELPQIRAPLRGDLHRLLASSGDGEDDVGLQGRWRLVMPAHPDEISDATINNCGR